jgi:4-amino-4-deoxy-L-arabinose transferase-like glycosyltransferase
MQCRNQDKELAMELQASQFSIKFLRRNFVIPTRTILLAIIVVAVILRSSSAFLMGNSVIELPGIADQISYDSLARRVMNGYGFSFAENHWPMTRAGEPTAHWSFLYTLYLAVLYTLFGPQPLIPRLVQAVLVGILQTYIIYRIGEKTFSRSVGIIAAGITAFYLYFIYYGGALMTEPFYITAILYSLLVAIQISEASSRSVEIKLGLFLGIALGITLLLRQVFLLFIPFLFLWIWISRYKRRLGMPILSTALSLGLLVVFILPVTFYNQSRFGRFVLLNTNSGFAFFWGNHPVYGTHFYPILPSNLGTYQDLVPQELRQLDEAALDQALLRRGLQFVIDDPKRYILLSLSRIPAYFEFWPSSGSGLISNISRVASFGIILPFVLYGLFLAIRRSFSEKGNRIINLFSSPVGLLILFVLIYSAIHLLTWALIRYRLPVDAVLIPFAALALSDLYSKVAKQTVS